MEVRFPMHQERAGGQVSFPARVDNPLKRGPSLFESGQPDERLPGRKIHLGRHRVASVSALFFIASAPSRASFHFFRAIHDWICFTRIVVFQPSGSVAVGSSPRIAEKPARAAGRITACKAALAAEVARLAAIRILRETQ